METVKEKLMKLLRGSNCPDGRTGSWLECNGCKYESCPDCYTERNADYLIQNGVTIQQWVSVDERLPETDGKYIVCTAKNAVYCAKYYAKGRFFGTDMNTHITHWMPLPSVEGLK